MMHIISFTPIHPPRRTAALGLLLLAACAGVPAAGEPDNRLPTGFLAADQIRWPAQYDPEEADFYVHNEIEVAAPAEVVWPHLVSAEAWPSWYEGAKGVKVLTSTTGQLHPEAVFAWETMDLEFESKVMELEAPYRLSWESRKGSIQGYHAWLVIPTATGCRVVTDESQHGFLTLMQKIFVPNKLRELHDIWLAGLKARAEASAAAGPEGATLR